MSDAKPLDIQFLESDKKRLRNREKEEKVKSVSVKSRIRTDDVD